MGVDEAGRGALAGPVLAAAVLFKKGFDVFSLIPDLDDSKRMSPKRREAAFEKIKNSKCIIWAVGSASQKEIDKVNILEATKLAMTRAIDKIGCKECFIIIDGNFSVGEYPFQKSVKGADGKIPQCSAASVIAKVKRDELMRGLHHKYSCYGFYYHKGYGTKKHMEAIKKNGPCLVHRRTFRGVL